MREDEELDFFDWWEGLDDIEREEYLSLSATEEED